MKFVLKSIPYLLGVGFFVVLFLLPDLPDAGIDAISEKVLHIPYIKGRILFAVLILMAYQMPDSDRSLGIKILSSLTLYLYPILLYIMYHVENALNFIPYTLILLLGGGETFFLVTFDVGLVFYVIYKVQFFINEVL